MLKLIVKTKSIRNANLSYFIYYLIAKIYCLYFTILSALLPPFLLLQPVHFGKDKGFHSLVIQTNWLSEIANV